MADQTSEAVVALYGVIGTATAGSCWLSSELDKRSLAAKRETLRPLKVHKYVAQQPAF